MKIFNQSKNTVLAEEAILAEGLFDRMKGLLGKRGIKKGQALILKPCGSIHTLFMCFPIDVIFVDKRNKVISTIRHLNPWRLSRVFFSSQLCIELPAGTIEATLTSVGDTISFLR